MPNSPTCVHGTSDVLVLFWVRLWQLQGQSNQVLVIGDRRSELQFKATDSDLQSQLFLLVRNTKGNNGLNISRQRHWIGIHEAAAFETMFHRRHFDVRPAFNLIARHDAPVVIQKKQRKKDYFHGPGPIDSMRLVSSLAEICPNTRSIHDHSRVNLPGPGPICRQKRQNPGFLRIQGSLLSSTGITDDRGSDLSRNVPDAAATCSTAQSCLDRSDRFVPTTGCGARKGRRQSQRPSCLHWSKKRGPNGGLCANAGDDVTHVHQFLQVIRNVGPQVIAAGAQLTGGQF